MYRWGFLDALRHLFLTGRVRRRGWNGSGMWLEAEWPDARSTLTHPFVVIVYPAGHPAYPAGSRIPWEASRTDLFADDWEQC